MIKKTLHIGNPAYLSTSLEQMVVELKATDQPVKQMIPVEDIGVVVLEHPQITLTAALLEKLNANKVAVIVCDKKYMPAGLMLPLDSNSEQTERMRVQLASSLPLRKQLWQQTIRAKIHNQATLLENLSMAGDRLWLLKDRVLSGDKTNCEAQAAAHYWAALYGSAFVRGRDMDSPNAQLNYGYAILRSIVARALVATGMNPSIGIHHRNKYNAYCLADDIMEPYRPYVDALVTSMADLAVDEGLTKTQKVRLLSLPQQDVSINGLKRPLFHAVSLTTTSLYKCFEGSQRRIHYPEL